MKLGLTASDVRRIVWSAVFAFVGVYATLVAGAGDLKSFDEAKAAVLSLLPAAIAAALSAVKNGILADSNPAK
jgi:hypothetical protein